MQEQVSNEVSQEATQSKTTNTGAASKKRKPNTGGYVPISTPQSGKVYPSQQTRQATDKQAKVEAHKATMQEREQQTHLVHTGDIALYKVVFAETEYKKAKIPFKFSGDVAIVYPKRMKIELPTGSEADEWIKMSRTTGTITGKEVNKVKGSTTLGKYSSKLLDVGTNELDLAGFKFKLSAGFMEFKTSLKDAKGLKSDTRNVEGLSKATSQKGKGMMGKGFDFDPFSLSLKITGELNQNNAGLDLFAFAARLPMVKQILGASGAVNIVASFKISPMMGFGDFPIMKKQKEALKKLETTKKSQLAAQAEMGSDTRRQTKLKDLKNQRNKLNRGIQKNPKLKKQLWLLEQQQQKVDKMNQQLQEARSSRKKLNSTAAQNQQFGLTSPKRKEELEKLKKMKAQMKVDENKLAKKMGLETDLPSRNQLIKEKELLKDKIKNQKQEIDKLKKEITQQIGEVEELGKKYKTKAGKLIGTGATKLAYIIAHLNVMLDALDGLALALALLLAPDRMTTIFSKKNTVSPLKLLNLLAKDRHEGNKESSANATYKIQEANLEEGTQTSPKTAKKTSKKPGNQTGKPGSSEAATKNTSNPTGSKAKKDNAPPKTGNARMLEIWKILQKNEQAWELWLTMLKDTLIQGPDQAMSKNFDASHARRLVSIAQRFGDQLNLREVMRKHSQEISQGNAQGTMDEYLDQLEGIYETATSKAGETTTEEKTSVDIAIHDQYTPVKSKVKTVGKPLTGRAEYARSIPKGTHRANIKGYFKIQKMGIIAKGRQATLTFIGTYNGRQVEVADLQVEIVGSNTESKVIAVKLAHLHIVKEKGQDTMYFPANGKAFNIRVK